MGIVKNGWGCLDYGTPKSGVSHKWFDELKRLIKLFLHADSDQIFLVFLCIFDI